MGRDHVGLRSRKQPVWPGRDVGNEAKEIKQGLAGQKRDRTLKWTHVCKQSGLFVFLRVRSLRCRDRRQGRPRGGTGRDILLGGGLAEMDG